MILDVVKNEEYKELAIKQITQSINFLLSKNHEFSITANIEAINFNPNIPNNIKEHLAKYTLFSLTNYTYSTITLDDKYLNFEAGFGNENFASIVSIPIHSIFQIIVDESILYINPLATLDEFNTNQKERSLEIFKNNPRNDKFS